MGTDAADAEVEPPALEGDPGGVVDVEVDGESRGELGCRYGVNARSLLMPGGVDDTRNPSAR